MTINTYSARPSAVRGLARHLGSANTEGVDLNALITKDGDKFVFDTEEADAAVGLGGLDEVSENLKLTCGHVNCPGCGIHLSNGLSDFEGMVDRHGSEAAAYKNGQKTEWMCLGCNHEFGEPIVLKGKQPKAPSEARGPIVNKSTITDVVNFCHTFFNANPTLRRKDAIAGLVEQGVAFYTARTQYQKWFTANKKAEAK